MLTTELSCPRAVTLQKISLECNLGVAFLAQLDFGERPSAQGQEPRMNEECANALRRDYGYVPDEDSGEEWVIHQDRLIVVHPERGTRLYRRGCEGSYSELKLEP